MVVCSSGRAAGRVGALAGRVFGLRLRLAVSVLRLAGVSGRDASRYSAAGRKAKQGTLLRVQVSSAQRWLQRMRLCRGEAAANLPAVAQVCRGETANTPHR